MYLQRHMHEHRYHIKSLYINVRSKHQKQHKNISVNLLSVMYEKFLRVFTMLPLRYKVPCNEVFSQQHFILALRIFNKFDYLLTGIFLYFILMLNFYFSNFPIY